MATAASDSEAPMASGNAACQSRELSGAFTDLPKWQECWQQLSSPDCAVGTLRIYHNSTAQLEGTAQALLGNKSIVQLDIGVVDGASAVEALSALLKVGVSCSTSSWLCCLQHTGRTACNNACSSILGMEHNSLQHISNGTEVAYFTICMQAASA
jgi:hypothetical protein